MNSPLTSETVAVGRFMPTEQYNSRWFERLMKRTVVNAKGCFVWQGPVTRKGYPGQAHRDWRTAGHRIVYMLTHGLELVTEQLVCHTCDERRCWNPGHLFLGTAGDNNKDCAAKGRHHNSVKTHCKYGHPYDEANTDFRELGTGSIARTCKTCEVIRMKKDSYIEWRRNYQRRRRAEKKAQRLAQSGDSHV